MGDPLVRVMTWLEPPRANGLLVCRTWAARMAVSKPGPIAVDESPPPVVSFMRLAGNGLDTEHLNLDYEWEVLGSGGEADVHLMTLTDTDIYQFSHLTAGDASVPGRITPVVRLYIGGIPYVSQG